MNKIIFCISFIFMLKDTSNVVTVVCYTCHQRFADLRWAGFLQQMLIRKCESALTIKLSAEKKAPLIANVLLSAVF